MTATKALARDSVRAATPFIVGTLLYIGALEMAPRFFRDTWFFDVGPGSSPPWYFIGQDAVDGAVAAGGFLLLCAFSILASGPLGPSVWAAFAANSVGFVGRMGLGVNVLVHTSQVWNRSLASTSWETFDEYLASQGHASTASLVVGMALGAGSLMLYVRALRRANTGPGTA